MLALESILKMVASLSAEGKFALLNALSSYTEQVLDMESLVTSERFSKGRVCSHCGCMHVVRNGHRKGGA